MEKSIEQLRMKKSEIAAKCGAVRDAIVGLTDEKSFVELTAFGFSEGEDEVVTGFATIGGYPFYIIAQNFAVSYGGLTAANCAKIAKAQAAAEKSGTPIIYILHSQGVCVREDANVLEGVSSVLRRATRLKGNVLQFAIVQGEVYGSSAALAALCDFVFYTSGGMLCLGSPFVLAAKDGKTLKPIEVGGYDAGAPLPAISVKDIRAAARGIQAIFELFDEPMHEAELNATLPALNKKADAETIFKLFEQPIEIGANHCPEVKTVLCRIGGISTAAVVLNEAKINAETVRKVKMFAELCYLYGLPFVTFVDCLGTETTVSAVNGPLLQEIGRYLEFLDKMECAKVAVVTGNAIGLGYSLFAAKSVGFQYTLAFAGAQIALLTGEEGADILGEDGAEGYTARHGSPIAVAKGGYLDDVVEPALIKQHLIAVLQMLG